MRLTALLILVLGAALIGGLLLVDRPGLEASYFSLVAPWEGRPVHVTVAEPVLGRVEEVAEVLTSDVGFSILWSGWWDVREAGRHRLSLSANDGAWVKVDGEIVVDTEGLFGEVSTEGVVELGRGFHEIEFGLFQRFAKSWMVPSWGPPGVETESLSLPGRDLYSGGPLLLRRALRAAVGSWGRPYRQFLGLAFLIGVVLLLRGMVERSGAGERLARLGEISRSTRVRLLLLVGLFLATFLVALPYAGYLRGGDAGAYLDAAATNKQYWFSARYLHVYLLKLFAALTGGDPLVGVRFWWSFAFAATVSAIAVGVRSVGPGLQVRTLAVVLFILISQTHLMGLIGNGLADFSAMMFVALGVGVYMYGYLAERAGADGTERPPPRREWFALAIGALTVCAFRSKEVGAILLVLPALFLFVEGRFDPRRFFRRSAYWLVGAGAAFGLLTALDALILGDPLFAIKPERLERMERMNFPSGRRSRGGGDWLAMIWEARNLGADLSLRYLWLGVCAGAIAAGAARRRVELRLVHLVPLAYLAAMILLYVRLPHPFSPRMLITISPIACLMAGLTLHHAGLDDLPWRRLLSPGVLLPLGLAVGLVTFVLVPFWLGTLSGEEFLPVEALQRFGWSPEHFTIGVLLPIGVLATVVALVLGSSGRALAVAALLALCAALFGTPFELTRQDLVKHRAEQLRLMMTYPWRTFGAELEEVSGVNVMMSQDLHFNYQMTRGRSSTARLALRRTDIWSTTTTEFPADAEAVIASREAWTRWRRGLPQDLDSQLVATASWDPFDFLVLLRPAAAARELERLERLELGPEELVRFGSLLTSAADDPSAGAYQHLLGRILATEALRQRPVQGDQLRAVGVSADKWTEGTRPAGLIVTNATEEPLIQRFRLAVYAPPETYPIVVDLHDGEWTETVIFERAGRKTVTLRELPPRSSRLITVRSDTEWTPEGGDQRRLGVRILAPRGP